jgi:hypothetical protein
MLYTTFLPAGFPATTGPGYVRFMAWQVRASARPARLRARPRGAPAACSACQRAGPQPRQRVRAGTSRVQCCAAEWGQAVKPHEAIVLPPRCVSCRRLTTWPAPPAQVRPGPGPGKPSGRSNYPQHAPPQPPRTLPGPVLASTFMLYAIGLGAGAIPTAGALNWILKVRATPAADYTTRLPLSGSASLLPCRAHPSQHPAACRTAWGSWARSSLGAGADRQGAHRSTASSPAAPIRCRPGTVAKLTHTSYSPPCLLAPPCHHSIAHNFDMHSKTWCVAAPPTYHTPYLLPPTPPIPRPCLAQPDPAPIPHLASPSPRPTPPSQQVLPERGHAAGGRAAGAAHRDGPRALPGARLRRQRPEGAGLDGRRQHSQRFPRQLRARQQHRRRDGQGCGGPGRCSPLAGVRREPASFAQPCCPGSAV